MSKIDDLHVKLNNADDNRIVIQDLRNQLDRIIEFYSGKELELKLKNFETKLDYAIENNKT